LNRRTLWKNTCALLLHRFVLPYGQSTQRSKKGLLYTLFSLLIDQFLKEKAYYTVLELLHHIISEKALRCQDRRESDVEELLCVAVGILRRTW
jgi:hypothetical protein